MVLMSSFTPTTSATASPGPPAGVSTPIGGAFGARTFLSPGLSSNTPSSSSKQQQESSYSSSSNSRKQQRRQTEAEDVGGPLANPLLSPGYYPSPAANASSTSNGGVSRITAFSMMSPSPSTATASPGMGSSLFPQQQQQQLPNGTGGGLRQRRKVGATNARSPGAAAASSSVTTMTLVPVAAAPANKAPEAEVGPIISRPPPPKASLSLETFAETHRLSQSSPTPAAASQRTSAPAAAVPGNATSSSFPSDSFHHRNQGPSSSVPSPSYLFSSSTSARNNSGGVGTSASGGGGGAWVMVYGYSTPEQFREVVKLFRSLGNVLQQRDAPILSGTKANGGGTGAGSATSQWVAFQYASPLHAAKALGQQHCEIVSSTGSCFVGVKTLPDNHPILRNYPQSYDGLFGGGSNGHAPAGVAPSSLWSSSPTKAFNGSVAADQQQLNEEELITEQDILLNFPGGAASAAAAAVKRQERKTTTNGVTMVGNDDNDDDDSLLRRRKQKGCCLRLLYFILNIHD